MAELTDPLALQRYLHDRIVQSQSMGVAVAEVSPERVVLTAPLAPNINVHGTVFGGSASSLAMLAAWSLLYTLLKTHEIPAELVIHSSHVEFRAPIKGEFRAVAQAPDAQTWSSFEHMLSRKGRARIKVAVDVEFEGITAARLEGTFVAVSNA
ncbi:MAG: YiiD C-terminal domain-containing protein [Gammaproteobacteria bacterium]|nr:YiiD C-terminal domain-containing protein [Gammaproteobacteria bacterium]